MLEKLRQWLESFPGWDSQIQIDYLDISPGNAGLYPRGITELSRREDVLGNVQVRCSCAFVLRMAALGAEAQARWLLDFQSWVMEQNALGLTPKFGDLPKNERLRAFEGKLDSHTPLGSALYTVQLSAEFTKLYEVN